MRSQLRWLLTIRRRRLGVMGVGENLARTPNPYLDAGRISCSERLVQIVGELRAATHMAEILQGRPLQEVLTSTEVSRATAS